MAGAKQMMIQNLTICYIDENINLSAISLGYSGTSA